MFRARSLAGICFVSMIFHAGLFSAAIGQDRKIDFGRDVQPIFQAHCIECHGPDQQMNGFRLDRRADALKGGTGTMIGRGNSAGSRLYVKLIGSEFGPKMPPEEPLAAEKIEIIKRWIDEGAIWPDALAGEVPVTIPDPEAAKMMHALRKGDWQRARKILSLNPSIVKRKGPGGSTPLMYAVLYGNAESVRILLEAGADPNASNDANATALMWAMDDVDKTRLLLRLGADVHARSSDGRTPLLIACSLPGAGDVVKLLLDEGAKPTQVVNSYRGPITPLRLAAEASDESLIRLLLDRGADAKALGGTLPLTAAINLNDPACVDLTLPFADPKALKSATIFVFPPFAYPGALRDPRSLNKFFEAGADINARGFGGRTLLMLAANSDNLSTEAVETLIRVGADLNAVAPDGRTVLDFESEKGRTPVVELLLKRGARPGREKTRLTFQPKPAATVRAAIERSLPLLQKADANFLAKSGCVSCHHNSLTAMTVALAREAGIPVDEEVEKDQRNKVGAYIEDWRERALQGMGIPGDSDTVNYTLVGLAAANHPPDLATDALARYLKNDQMPDGRWRLIATRPPLGSSEFELTAFAMRAIQVYTPKTQKPDYERAVWRAADWLRSNKPYTTADRAFQLIGLTWVGDSKESLVEFARELLAEQRSDGGWAQLPTMKSDAYATGQALVALHRSRAISTEDTAYQRGIEYLRSTQLGDGSWHVTSRSIPLQPYFESGFPHGPDQWISAAATNWATMALIPAVD